MTQLRKRCWRHSLSPFADFGSCLELSRALGRLFRRMFLPASRMKEPSPRGPLFCANYSIQSQIRESEL